MKRQLRWTGDVRDDGEIAFRVGRSPDGLIAEWPGRLTLECDEEGARPVFARVVGADEEAVRRLERGLGAALIDQARGEMSLHASVVAHDGRAVACVGDSGAGKSTTAASLCARAGFTLLRDDIAPIRFETDRVTVLPGDAAHSLAPEAASALGVVAPVTEQFDGKLLVAAPASASTAALTAVVALRFDDEVAGPPTLRRLRGVEAIGALVPSVVRLIVDDPKRMAAEVSTLMNLCGRVGIYELRRPRDFEQLTACAELLIRLHEGNE